MEPAGYLLMFVGAVRLLVATAGARRSRAKIPGAGRWDRGGVRECDQKGERPCASRPEPKPG